MHETADVVFEDDRWQRPDLAEIWQTCCNATLDHVGLVPHDFEIAILACDDGRIAALNTTFRDKPAPTNVLSWPAGDLAAEIDGETPELPPTGAAGQPESLGDIAIAFDTCQREADALNLQFASHVAHLLVHGCLHLLGYDHISDKDATLMEQLEVEILAKLGIANPY